MASYFNFQFENMSEETSLKFKEVFDDGDTVVLETEKVFKHVEVGLIFEYRYAIEVLDYFEITGNKEYEGMKYITLYLVPTVKSLNATIIKSLKDIYKDDFNNIGTNELLAEGYAIRFLYELVDNAKENECVLFAKHLIPHLDNMRGFYLDEPINMIGTDGWKMLHDYINNESWLKY